MLIKILKKRHSGHIQGRYLCKCGNFYICNISDVKRGMQKSCGCFKNANTSRRFFKHGGTINGKISPEYDCWSQLKQRCLNPKNHGYKDYGGRGITVCKRWIHSFKNFLKDMGKRPYSTYSIDRINNDKGYKPSNCRWTSKIVQTHNRRPL